MSIYTVTTMERKYDKSPFVKNILHMNQRKFDAFLATKGLYVTEELDEEEQFEQYGITFNSSVRHTACRVILIEKDQQVLYNYGGVNSRVCTRMFEERLKKKLGAKEVA